MLRISWTEHRADQSILTALKNHQIATGICCAAKDILLWPHNQRRRVLAGKVSDRGDRGWLGHFSLTFSQYRQNMYDRDFELTRQGRGILPLQTVLISFVVTSFVVTEYGTCQRHVVELSQPTPSRGRLGQYTGYLNVCVLRAHS